jgi:hypothetical protein
MHIADHGHILAAMITMQNPDVIKLAINAKNSKLRSETVHQDWRQE